MAPSDPRTRVRVLPTLVFALLVAAVIAGANALSFLCDDAFIGFRYVANAHAGHGPVWNPEPFAPVEGYTSFGWLLVLWGAWNWLGVEPPDSANALSIAFGLGQFTIAGFAASRLRTRDGSRVSGVVALVALAVLAANHTFLQWMTGGLDTAMFNFFFIAWVLWAFRRQTETTNWLAMWSLLAMATSLLRPDGLLLAATTIAVASLTCLRRRRPLGATALGLLPLVAIAAHVLWRRSFYGEWLPNTYYAKVVEAWPEAGARYLACFAFENGTWVLPLVLLAWLPFARRATWRPAALAAVGAVLCHVGYYTIRVGGDQFGYRVLSHVVPLVVLATTAAAASATRGPWWPIAATSGLGFAATAGWLHLALPNASQAHFQPLATEIPAAMAPLVRWHDRFRAWLAFHNIGLRRRSLVLAFERFRERVPDRVMLGDAYGPHPAITVGAAGIAGWNLPDCAVLDRFGLNDWVVARTPPVATPRTELELDPGQWRVVLRSADSNGDGWLDLDEVRAALALMPGARGQLPVEFLASVLVAVHGYERTGALTYAEAENLGAMLFGRVRRMGHERSPPAGYFEAFEPNVTLRGGAVHAEARSSPLTAARIREIEATWRARVREER